MGTEPIDDKYIPLVGATSEYVGRSPWDFYSWGHICTGIAAFLIFSLLITLTEIFIGPPILMWWHVLSFVVIFAIIWELFENIVLWRLGVKFENRQDSIWNSLWDIIFTTGGGLLAWLIKYIIINLLAKGIIWFYIYGAAAFGVVFLFYLIGFLITSRK